jgi:arsenate reductase-like glutaredoxin family protein
MYALIYDSQLILGPIGYNYRLINSELEELEIEQRVSPRDYENVPIQIDANTYVLPAIQIIPSYDSRFENVGNFSWEIIKENDIPVRVEMTYPVTNKSLETIKEEYKQQIAPIRKEKENTYIDVELNGTTVSVSTNREDRLSYVSKLIASPGTHKFKFGNGVWLEITTTELEHIISQIDLKVQEAFDWEYSKLQEIDACITGEEVYNVILREPQIMERPDALPTDN